MTLGVAIVSHNPKPEWLAGAIRSLYPVADSISLVDNGSSPRIDSFIDDYFGMDISVFVNRSEANLPLDQAYNLAILALDTDFVMMFSDDDIGITSSLQDMKRLIQPHRNPPDIITTRISLFAEKGVRVFGQAGEFGESLDISQIAHQNHIAGCSWFRRSVWEALDGFKPKRQDSASSHWLDWDFWVRAAMAGYEFGYFPKPVMNFRVKKDGYSAKQQEQYQLTQ